MAQAFPSAYHKYVDLQNVSGSGDPESAPVGGVYLFASGSGGSAKLYVQNEGESSPVDLVGASSLTISDGTATDTVTVGTDTFTVSGSINAISASLANNQIQMHVAIDKVSALSTVADGDTILVDDGDGGTLRKITRANFIESAALDNIDIDGGAIDGTPIGANSQAAGEFTTVSGSGAATFASTVTAQGNILPLQDGAVDLGSSSKEFKDLYIDGVAYVDELQADQLGAALDANNQAITNINVDSGAVDGITLGKNSAVTDSNFTILTASNAQITNLDVVTLNSITQTDTTLEISDKLIVAALSASSANASGGGLRIGGGASSNGHAEIVWNNGNSALDFSIGNTPQASIVDGAFRPHTNNDVDLGTSSNKFKDLFLSGDADVAGALTVAGNFSGSALVSSDLTSGRVVLAGADGVLEDSANLTFGSSELTILGALSASANSSFGGNVNMLNSAIIFKSGEATSGIANNSGQAVFGISADRTGSFQSDLAIAGQTTFGGGFGSTGVTISAGGNIQANGTLQVDGNSTIGQSGTGADFTVHGATAGEKVFFDASENILQITGSAASGLQVNIGGDATSEFAIDVANGSNNNNKIRAAAFVTYSDESLKTDVTSMADTALDTIMSLNGVEFTWKNNGERDFGFIAQEVQKVVPKAVHTHTAGVQGVDYSRLSSILVEAVKAQQVQIEDLKKTLAKLKK